MGIDFAASSLVKVPIGVLAAVSLAVSLGAATTAGNGGMGTAGTGGADAAGGGDAADAVGEVVRGASLHPTRSKVAAAATVNAMDRIMTTP